MIDSEFRYAEDLEFYIETYQPDQPFIGQPDPALVEWRLAEKLMEIGANTQPDEKFLEYLETQIQEVVRSPVDTIVQTDYRACNIQFRRSFGRIPRFLPSNKGHRNYFNRGFGERFPCGDLRIDVPRNQGD